MLIMSMRTTFMKNTFMINNNKIMVVIKFMVEKVIFSDSLLCDYENYFL